MRPAPSLRCRLALALAVATLTGVSVARADAPVDVPGSPSWWASRLAQAPGGERRALRRRLLDLGPAAPLVLRAMALHADPRVRREAALGLAYVGTPTDLQRLLTLACDADPHVGAAAGTSLVHLGRPAYLAVRDAQTGTATPDRRMRLAWLERQILTGLVERRLRREIGADGDFGTWRGQFDDLRPEAAPVLDVLLPIFSGSQTTLLRLEATLWDSVRVLAGEAIGELGNPSLRVPLEALAGDADESIASTARIALFKLNLPRFLRTYISSVQRKLDATPRNDDFWRHRHLKELGSCFFAMGGYRRAIDIYGQALAIDGSDQYAHYNVACAYARLNEVDDALRHIKRAVELGYAGSLLPRDGDLAPVRKDPRFAREVLPIWRRNRSAR